MSTSIENSDVLYFDPSKADISISGRHGDSYPGLPLPDNDHIRLVELLAVRIPSDVSVMLKFKSVRLDTAPDFYALSYTWGASTGKTSIQGINVTDNLLSAILNLAEAEPRFWWIDALCINQSDLEEKSEQVQIMRSIYQKATQVCVWLGDPDPTSLQLLQKISGNLEAQMMADPELDFSDAGFAKLGLPGIKDPAWGSLVRFLARPYFRRVWVLQELVMARKPIEVACGAMRFSWYLIALPIHWLRLKNLQAVLQSQHITNLQTQEQRNNAPDADIINLSFSLESRSDPISFEYLIGATRYLQSTVPKDKIIALLGLASQEDRSISKIIIDYKQSDADFFREVTGTIITTNRSLKLMSLVTDTSSSKVPGLPSWVPDYSINMDRPSYRYAHFSTPSGPVEVEWSSGTGILDVWGQIKDEIQFVAEETASYGKDTADVLLSWFHDAIRFLSADEWSWIVSLGDPDLANSIGVEGFWRTMILDFVEARCPAPDEYRNHFATVVLDAFLDANSDNLDWLLDLAAALTVTIHGERETVIPKVDGVLETLIRLAKSAMDEGRRVEDPGWMLPREWITLNEDDEYTLKPSGEGSAFLTRMNCTGSGRFFITKEGRMGKGPLHLQTGDQIAIVKGTDQIFIMRKNVQNFHMVGECFVDGLMHGKGQSILDAPQKITLL